MQHFKHLRETPWNPTFEWVRTTLECANKINSYHEDYPKYVKATNAILQSTTTDNPPGRIFSGYLKVIHKLIFSDKFFAGEWRKVDVVVGLHHPPRVLVLSGLMEELESLHSISDIKDLTDWYTDFETIHPFQDGNGRVGGVIIAAYSHGLHPEEGWLAPNQ